MDRVIALGATEYFFFTTRDFDTGAPQTLGGTPALSAYEDNGTTEITSGVSISADFDTRTGLNVATVVATAGNGFEAGKLYNLVITTGTVDTVSVVGEVVATFRIETAAENAIREANEAMFLADTPTDFTGNTTTAINLTGIIDSSARADDVINETFLVKWEGGTFDGLALLAVVTDYAVTNQLATVELIGTEGALPEAVASGDKVIRVGDHATVSNISANEDGSGLTEVGGDGDHLTAVPLNTAWFTTAIAEGYSTDGADASMRDLLYEAVALLSEFAVSGTTVTVRQRDGSTTAMTLTLDSATDPTSTTRAT